MMEAVKTTTVLSQVPAETEIKGKAIKKSGKRIGYNYIILKSLKESQKNDVVKCLYIKSLTNFGICVIKEGSYGDSKDKEGRDIKDRLLWQKQLHEQLQNKVYLPKLLGSFEENGNYYLVLERIKGKSLYKACKEKGSELREGLIKGNKTGLVFLDYMMQLTRLLQELHSCKVVHRDVTATNFMITPKGKVAVIDMELSYSLEKSLPAPPFQLGTYGYMSPQQEATLVPTVQEDVFSLGAILLLVWTNMSPSKLTDAPPDELYKKIYFLVPDRQFADIIIRCLQSDAEKRPTLEEVAGVIENYRREVQTRNNRLQSSPLLFTKENMHDTIQATISTLASPLLADEKKGWFSENKNLPPNPDKKKIIKAWYASFARGAMGIVYTLSKAAQTGFDTSAMTGHIEKALLLVSTKYIDRIDVVSPSLFNGAPGIAVCLASALREGLIEPQGEYFDWITRLLTVENKIQNYSDGMAGQALAHLSCASFLNTGWMSERLNSYADLLIDSQQKDGSWEHISKKKRYKIPSFSKGVAGIIFYLLKHAAYKQDRSSLDSARRGLEWLMKTSVRQKDSFLWLNTSKKPLHHGFNDGAQGIALAFITAYNILGDSKYRQYAAGALRSVPIDVLDNNLGQSNGLSGLGEIYLEAWQTFRDEEWLERANRIAQTIMHLKRSHKDYGPYWLVDHERQPVAEFMNGNSGIIHFLLRYCYPDQISIPFLEYKYH